MSTRTTAFYRVNTEISVYFSGEGVSSDGTVVLLDKLERCGSLEKRSAFQRYPWREDGLPADPFPV